MAVPKGYRHSPEARAKISAGMATAWKEGRRQWQKASTAVKTPRTSLRVESWRAHYADGSEHVGTGPPAGLPPEGLVCVMEYGPRPYRTLVGGGDWYWFADGRWHSSGTGDWETWLPKPHPDAIRSTTRLPDEVHDAIIRRAYALGPP